MKKKIRPNFCSLMVIVPILLFFYGCKTPRAIKAVQDYTKIQSKSAEIFPKIANDSYLSCIRSSNYISLSLDPISVENNENFLIQDESNDISIDRDRVKRENQCNDPDTGNIAVRNAFNQTHGLINDYLKSLGQLAQDDLVNFDPEVQAIGTAIKKLPGLNDGNPAEAVDAGTTLAGLLFKAFTNNYRRKELKEAILLSDSSLITLVLALNRSVKNHYIDGYLASERLALDQYYELSIGLLLAQDVNGQPGIQEYTKDKLNADWLKKQAIIREKKVLATSYLSLLKRIACGHSNLKLFFLKSKNSQSLPLSCSQRPELAPLYSELDFSPEYAIQVIEDYSNEMIALNEKAKQLFDSE